MDIKFSEFIISGNNEIKVLWNYSSGGDLLAQIRADYLCLLVNRNSLRCSVDCIILAKLGKIDTFSTSN